jgi:hypothetical protein
VQIRHHVLPWQDPGSGIHDGFSQVVRVINKSHGAISDIAVYFELDPSGRCPGVYRAAPDVTSRPAGWAEVSEVRARDLGVLPVDRLDADQIIDLIGPAYSEDKASVTRAEVRFTDDMGRR